MAYEEALELYSKLCDACKKKVDSKLKEPELLTFYEPEYFGICQNCLKMFTQQ